MAGPDSFNWLARGLKNKDDISINHDVVFDATVLAIWADADLLKFYRKNNPLIVEG